MAQYDGYNPKLGFFGNVLLKVATRVAADKLSPGCAGWRRVAIVTLAEREIHQQISNGNKDQNSKPANEA
ncbi:MAG: hypothetical protein COT91_01305 [Candidatus Doudnabacteria bacterium CG10_big_fil_rev_8_21_14_0_10_41_10]|uniref:Uncharacterized protein n=1 Tax=Candidatus Doudnabacteria bacterium CG10_big_fil_rev_8_21_14_0_10_41_10 TaxID=1974551 RepID=A0A2H0VE74_9BACT|nr:MAG: hypothetical protein COT91_01305 [Candidatus Doudnabacteria bacterium CG10_big_fil_rev_8_21_14_0_10_41_10]